MANTKISEGNVVTAEGTFLVPVYAGTPGEAAQVVTCQTIANLAPSAGGTPGGTRVGSALTGNGTTDVTSTLQASINSTPSGSTWILDPGTAGREHRITDTLTIPAGISCDMSNARVTFTFTDRPAVVVGTNGSPNSQGRWIVSTRGTMSSGTFQSASSEEGVGVRFINTRDGYVEVMTERSYIGTQFLSRDGLGCTGLRVRSIRSVDHKVHFDLRTRGSSGTEGATPGTATAGEYVNGVNIEAARVDNSSVIGSADSVAYRLSGSHGGYNRIHGNSIDIGQCQLQNHATAQRRIFYIANGQNEAENNTLTVRYIESGNGAVGEIHSSNSGNGGNVINALDWVPDNPAEILLEWTGSTTGFGGRNYVYGPESNGTTSTVPTRFVGQRSKPSWSSGNLVDYLNYYNDGTVTLNYGMHKLTSDTIYTNQTTLDTNNITPRENFIAIQTGGIFFWLNTEWSKKFNIWKDIVDGFPGRLLLCPADINKVIISTGSEIVAVPGFSTQASTNYVGSASSALVQTSDVDDTCNIGVSSACKWLLVGVIPGSTNCYLKELHITSIDGCSHGPVHVQGDPVFGDRRGKTAQAAKTPAISTGATLFGYGKYKRGDVLENDGSVTARSTTKRWVCPSNMVLAPTWRASSSVGLGTLRTGTAAAGSSGNVYRCVTAGTTTTGNGPTGTSMTSKVTDGTAEWLYYAPAFSAWTAET